MYISNIIIVLCYKDVLIYDIHWFIYLLNVHNEMSYFGSIKLLK